LQFLLYFPRQIKPMPHAREPATQHQLTLNVRKTLAENLSARILRLPPKQLALAPAEPAVQLPEVYKTTIALLTQLELHAPLPSERKTLIPHAVAHLLLPAAAVIALTEAVHPADNPALVMGFVLVTHARPEEWFPEAAAAVQLPLLLPLQGEAAALPVREALPQAAEEDFPVPCVMEQAVPPKVIIALREIVFTDGPAGVHQAHAALLAVLLPPLLPEAGVLAEMVRAMEVTAALRVLVIAEVALQQYMVLTEQFIPIQT
jgi:hypothetical protein